MGVDVFGLKKNKVYMKYHWRKLYSVLPSSIERRLYCRYFEKEHTKWVTEGKPLPFSHLSKQLMLKDIARHYELTILVETGTYMGDMLFALQNDFENLYSIELSKFFYQRANKRFRNTANIHLLQGDSGIQLHQLVPDLTKAALFWLDGHYSGGLTAKGEKECPVYEELKAIFQSSLNHAIIIDDARLFNGSHDYPAIEELKEFVRVKKPLSQFVVENDLIKITP